MIGMNRRAPTVDESHALKTWITTGQARQMRLDAGLTLAAIAEDCEVDPAAVLRWERGDHTPRGRNAAVYFRFLSRLAAMREAIRETEPAA
jgi:transcriptional regulator with XRE-family HTH domain